MKKYGVLILIGLAIVLSLKLFCSSGRYQIAFGNIQQRWVGYDEILTGDNLENLTVSVCIKIDTFTGECWIYQDNHTLYPSGENAEEEGFQKIPKYKRK